MRKQFFDEQFDLGGKIAAFWALNAQRLKQSGDLVFNAYASDVEKLFKGVSPLELENLEISHCAMLLYGLSIENLVKGVIIESDPSLISNGKLGKWPGGGEGGHDLIGLFKEAGIQPSEIEKDILTRLTAFVLWAGRYKIPKSSEKMAVPQLDYSDPFLPRPFSAYELPTFNNLYQSLYGRLIQEG